MSHSHATELERQLRALEVNASGMAGRPPPSREACTEGTRPLYDKLTAQAETLTRLRAKGGLSETDDLMARMNLVEIHQQQSFLSVPAKKAQPTVRVDAATPAVSSPEIQRLERALQERRQAEELKHRAPPGQAYLHSERDETGRLVRSWHARDEDQDVFWRQYTHYPNSIRAGQLNQGLADAERNRQFFGRRR